MRRFPPISAETDIRIAYHLTFIQRAIDASNQNIASIHPIDFQRGIVVFQNFQVKNTRLPTVETKFSGEKYQTANGRL